MMCLVGTLAGCAVTWVRIDSGNTDYRGAHYEVSLPAGWVRFEKDDTVLLSRDGPDLQRILIEYRPHDKGFESLKRTSSPDMLPSELADLMIGEIRAGAEQKLPSLEVLSNAPVEIGGQAGFALHLRFKTDQGLGMELLICGFIDKRGLYLLTYRAPTLHYFERDRAVFESIATSFRAS
jgi:hypothetical protein